MGFAGVSKEVRLPAEDSTSAPGIRCVAKPALESRENPIYLASSVQRLVLQNRDLLGVEKARKCGRFSSNLCRE